MPKKFEKLTQFHNNLFIIGFGSIGKGTLPLILRHLEIPPSNITIITKSNDGKEFATEYGVNFVVKEITKKNYIDVLNQYFKNGDFLLNLSIEVSSYALINYCQKHNILYLDSSIEPWEGGFVDTNLSSSERSNYALREAILTLKKSYQHTATALVAHGANPGLVSHFVKRAMINIAKDLELDFEAPKRREEWATLSKKLSIKVIHIAERDTQITNQIKQRGEFVNTWSIDGFVAESSQPAELGWGSHEKYWPQDGYHHDFGTRCTIYLNRPGAATFVRTWTPLSGSFHAYLITHAETISIADYFTERNEEQIHYRPTVHFAYHPCEDAVLSMRELLGNEWEQQPQQRLLFDEIIEGVDELGVLLMGHAKGAYWFGSQLSIDQVRALAPFNNATSLQVAAGVVAGMTWVIENPLCGIVEPDEIPHDYILNIAERYLGQLVGHYTNWTPLAKRERLFPEPLDKTDPWQFINIRVI